MSAISLHSPKVRKNGHNEHTDRRTLSIGDIQDERGCIPSVMFVKVFRVVEEIVRQLLRFISLNWCIALDHRRRE